MSAQVITTDTIKIYSYCDSPFYTSAYDSSALPIKSIKCLSYPCSPIKCMFFSDTLTKYILIAEKKNVNVNIIANKISASQLKINVKKGYSYIGRDAELTNEYIDNNLPNGVTVLNRIYIKINSKEIIIPFGDLLSPHIMPEYTVHKGKQIEMSKVLLSSNPNYVFINISGSDGAGNWGYFLIINDKGEFSKYWRDSVSGEYSCEENDFFDPTDGCNFYEIRSINGNL